MLFCSMLQLSTNHRKQKKKKFKIDDAKRSNHVGCRILTMFARALVIASRDSERASTNAVTTWQTRGDCAGLRSQCTAATSAILRSAGRIVHLRGGLRGN